MKFRPDVAEESLGNGSDGKMVTYSWVGFAGNVRVRVFLAELAVVIEGDFGASGQMKPANEEDVDEHFDFWEAWAEFPFMDHGGWRVTDYHTSGHQTWMVGAYYPAALPRWESLEEARNLLQQELHQAVSACRAEEMRFLASRRRITGH